MDSIQQREFEVMCNTAQLFLTSYYRRRFMPLWLFQMWHPRGKQVSHINKTIQTLKLSAKANSNFMQLSGDLIRTLVNHYYFLCVHTVSQRLREKVQDALLATLNFTEKDVAVYHDLIEKKNDLDAYLNYFQHSQQLQAYRDYFAKKHAVFGVDASQLSERELMMAAKSGLINGKILHRFNFKQFLIRCLIRVKNELQTLINDRIEIGFLNFESIKSYMHKIDLVLQKCQDPEIDDNEILKDSRSILENIINTAGVLPLGPARHPEHAVLIASCYWVDEFLQQARAHLEVE